MLWAGPVGKRSQREAAFNGTAIQLPAACLGGFADYTATGFEDSPKMEIVLLDNAAGELKLLSTQTPENGQKVWNYEIKWLLEGRHIMGLVETTDGGCTNDTVYYEVQVTPLHLDLANAAVCEGDTFLFTLPGFATYQWNSEVGGPVLPAWREGNYSVVVTDAQGCIGYSTAQLDVRNRPALKLGRDTILCEQSTVTLDASDSGANRYDWFTDKIEDNTIEGNIAPAIEAGSSDKMYRVWVEATIDYEDGLACTSSDTVKILPCTSTYLIPSIPNVITPNNDGYNDEWIIPNLERFPNSEISIYDRWGRQVFYSKPAMSNKFVGRSSTGKNLPMDSYHYILRLNNGTEPIVGNITIVR